MTLRKRAHPPATDLKPQMPNLESEISPLRFHTFACFHRPRLNTSTLAKATELAEKIAGNAPLTNFAILQALPRIAESGMSEGLLTESLMSAIAQGEPEAKARVAAFLAKRAPKVGES